MGYRLFPDEVRFIDNTVMDRVMVKLNFLQFFLEGIKAYGIDQRDINEHGFEIACQFQAVLSGFADMDGESTRRL